MRIWIDAFAYPNETIDGLNETVGRGKALPDLSLDQPQRGRLAIGRFPIRGKLGSALTIGRIRCIEPLPYAER